MPAHVVNKDNDEVGAFLDAIAFRPVSLTRLSKLYLGQAVPDAHSSATQSLIHRDKARPLLGVRHSLTYTNCSIDVTGKALAAGFGGVTNRRLLPCRSPIIRAT